MNFSSSALPALLACAMLPLVTGQQVQKKSYVFRGTVRDVDTAAKQLSITNEPIPGGMGAMTMTYSVDNEDVLNRVKRGDGIAATMYEGEMTLHDVRVITPSPQETQPLTTGLRLEELERIAIAGNPTVAQAQAGVLIAAGMARQAGLYPNPTVGYYGDEIRGGYIGGGKQGGFISQTIVTGGKLRAARRVAILLTEQSRTLAETQRLRVLNNARIVFYQVLADQRLVDVRQNLRKLADDATQTSYQLANVGQADRPDVLQAEVERQQTEVSLRIAEQNLRSSWRTLAAVVGKPDLQQTRLEGDLQAVPELNYEEWLVITLRDSPEIKFAEQSVVRAEASLSQAQKLPIPDLQLFGNVSQNSEPLGTTRRPTGVNGGAQIGVQLPIFNRNQGSISAARAEIEVAKQDLVRLRLQLARDLGSMFRDYEAARVTVTQYKTEMLPRAEQAYRLYRTNYQKMAAAYPQALISQRTLFQLEVEYVQALESAWQAALAIRGFGLIDGLSAPVPPGPSAMASQIGGNQAANGVSAMQSSAR